MLETYRDIIIKHEEDYANFIEYSCVLDKPYDELREAIAFFGREHPNELVEKFREDYADDNWSDEAVIKRIIGFMDVILTNQVKTPEFFKSMNLKETYIYISKRMLFNKKYIIKCPNVPHFENIIDRIENDKVTLIPFSHYIKGL